MFYRQLWVWTMAKCLVITLIYVLNTYLCNYNSILSLTREKENSVRHDDNSQFNLQKLQWIHFRKKKDRHTCHKGLRFISIDKDAVWPHTEVAYFPLFCAKKKWNGERWERKLVKILQVSYWDKIMSEAYLNLKTAHITLLQFLGWATGLQNGLKFICLVGSALQQRAYKFSHMTEPPIYPISAVFG